MKKSEVAQVYKGADEKSWQELLDDLRPQGEWVKIGEIGLAYKCNKCDEVNVIPENFCPHCGADMRGSEENEQ